MWWLTFLVAILKQFVYDPIEKPDIICVQETWLKPCLHFRVYGYIAVRYDREEGKGGGCLTLIKEGIPCRKIGRKGELEYVGLRYSWERR